MSHLVQALEDWESVSLPWDMRIYTAGFSLDVIVNNLQKLWQTSCPVMLQLWGALTASFLFVWTRVCPEKMHVAW